jgi:hypothetical protein
MSGSQADWTGGFHVRLQPDLTIGHRAASLEHLGQNQRVGKHDSSPLGYKNQACNRDEH